MKSFLSKLSFIGTGLGLFIRFLIFCLKNFQLLVLIPFIFVSWDLFSFWHNGEMQAQEVMTIERTNGEQTINILNADNEVIIAQNATVWSLWKLNNQTTEKALISLERTKEPFTYRAIGKSFEFLTLEFEPTVIDVNSNSPRLFFAIGSWIVLFLILFFLRSKIMPFINGLSAKADSWRDSVKSKFSSD